MNNTYQSKSPLSNGTPVTPAPLTDGFPTIPESNSKAWGDALAKKMPPSGITIDTGDVANDSLRISLAARDAEIERLTVQLAMLDTELRDANQKINEYAVIIDDQTQRIHALNAAQPPVEFDHYITANAMEFESLDSAIDHVVNSGTANTVYGCVRLGATKQITRWVPHRA